MRERDRDRDREGQRLRFASVSFIFSLYLLYVIPSFIKRVQIFRVHNIPIKISHRACEFREFHFSPVHS